MELVQAALVGLDTVRLEPEAIEQDKDSTAAVEVGIADRRKCVDLHVVVLYLSCVCGIHWQCDQDDHNNGRSLCGHALFLSWGGDLWSDDCGDHWSDLVAVAADAAAAAAAGIDLVE